MRFVIKKLSHFVTKFDLFCNKRSIIITAAPDHYGNFWYGTLEFKGTLNRVKELMELWNLRTPCYHGGF